MPNTQKLSSSCLLFGVSLALLVVNIQCSECNEVGGSICPTRKISSQNGLATPNDETSLLQAHVHVSKNELEQEGPDDKAKYKEKAKVGADEAGEDTRLMKDLKAADGTLEKDKSSEMAKVAQDDAEAGSVTSAATSATGPKQITAPPCFGTEEYEKTAKAQHYGVAIDCPEDDTSSPKDETSKTSEDKTSKTSLMQEGSNGHGGDQHQHTEHPLSDFMLNDIQKMMGPLEQMAKKDGLSEQQIKEIERHSTLLKKLESWVVEHHDDPFLLELNAAHAGNTPNSVTQGFQLNSSVPDDETISINGGWGTEWRQLTPGAALGGAFGGAGTMLAKIIQGKTPTWKEGAGLALDIVGSLNPILGLVCSIFKQLLGDGAEDEVAKKISAAISKESARTLTNELLGIREELEWVPDMLSDKNNVEPGVRLSYFIMVQHVVAIRWRNVFHEKCEAQKPWRAVYQKKVGAKSLLEVISEVRRRKPGSKSKVSSKTVANTKQTGLGAIKDAECKTWVKDPTRIDLMITFAQLHLQVLGELVKENPKLRHAVNQRIVYVAWRYQGMLNLALGEYIPWRLGQFSCSSQSLRQSRHQYTQYTCKDKFLPGCYSGCGKLQIKGRNQASVKQKLHRIVADKEWNRLYPEWVNLVVAAKGAMLTLSSEAQTKVSRQLGVKILVPPPEYRCTRDSDECLQKSTAYNWKAYTCAEAVATKPGIEGYCTIYAKDMLRCCSQSCGVIVPGVCSEASCKKLKGSGKCTYPNMGAPCSEKKGKEWCPITAPNKRGKIQE